MPWNNGIFTRVYNWVQDALDGLNIEATRVGGEDDNFASGINSCITKDGTNSPVANLPMANRKHTGVAAAVNRNEYLDMASYQDGAGIYGGESTGDADDYVITAAPAITAYVQGMMFRFKANVACNDDATINVNGVGARPLEVEQSAIVAGEIVIDGMYGIIYDGGAFQLLASGGESSSSFVALRDTPDDYVDQATKIIAVNTDEDAVVFTSPFLGAAIYMVEGTDDFALSPNAGGVHTIPMSGETIDSLGMHDPLVNPERLVVPVGYAGIYEFSWIVSTYTNQNLADDMRGFLTLVSLLQDLHPVAGSYVGGQGANENIISMQANGVIELAEGDEVYIWAANYDNTYTLTPAWDGATSNYTYGASLSLRYLGA